MQRLKKNEIEKKRCSKCDYMNNQVPISDKKPSCSSLGIETPLRCEIYVRTSRLEARIKYLRGEISGIFYCRRGHGGKCSIDTYEMMDEDKVPFYCPVDTCPEYNEKVCPKQCNVQPQE